MTVRAQLHDGTVLEFPEGTDPAVVQAAVKRHLSGKSQPATGGAAARRDAEASLKFTSGSDRALKQGFSLGFDDELAAAGQAGETVIASLLGKNPGYTPGEAFSARMDAERGARERFAKERPVGSAGLTLAGGLLTPGVGVAGRLISRGGGLIQTSLRSAMAGGLLGGAAGAGTADGGLLERAQGAGTGAVAGAVVGGALPGAARAGQTALRAVDNATGGVVGRTMGGYDARAAERLRQALHDDGVDPATARRAITAWQTAGNDAPGLLDIAGENTRALIRTAASRPGDARTTAVGYARQTVQSAASRGDRRAAAIAPGAPSANRATEALETRRGALASTEYAAPYAAQVQPTPESIEALGSETGRAALRRAATSARDMEGGPAIIGEIESLLNDPAAPVSGRTMDYVRQELRQLGQGFSARPGYARRGAGAYRRMGQVDSALDSAPGLGDARETYRDLSGAIERIDTGRKLFTLSADDFADELGAMSAEQRQGAIVGVRQALREAFQAKRGGHTKGVFEDIAGAQDVQANLRAVLGDDETNRYIAAATNEIERLNNANFVSPNTGSQTQLRGADAARAGLSMFRGNIIQPILERLVRGLTLTDREAAIIADMGTQEAQAALARLAPTQRQQALRLLQTRGLLGAANTAGGLINSP